MWFVVFYLIQRYDLVAIIPNETRFFSFFIAKFSFTSFTFCKLLIILRLQMKLQFHPGFTFFVLQKILNS